MAGVAMDRRNLIVGSALSGLLWSGIVLFLMMVADWRSNELDRLAWGVRGGILAAPFIGIGMGLLGWPFRNTWAGARIVLAVVSVYLASFLFWLAAGSLAWLVADSRHPRGSELIAGSFVAAIAGLTWTGFVVVLAPLAFLNHLLISRVGHAHPETPG